MKVSEIGEFGLIELLAEIAGTSHACQPVIIGIGDDAAAWQGDASIQLATTDTLVQGVHFHSETTTWRELGWKALAVNLSDIAAMGGCPRYALVSLGLSGDTPVEQVSDLYEGMVELARQFDVAIVGGDVISAPLLVITVTLLGGLEGGDSMLTRSAAVPGDRVAVTGWLGASSAGLKMLTHQLPFDAETAAFLREAHLQPHPRVVEGQLLLLQGVRAAIDISDGLVADLLHICQASKVGAQIRVPEVPIHPSLRDAFQDESLDFALSGGEDYELLFSASQEVIERVQKVASCPVTVIGEITSGKPGEVILINEAGEVFSRNNIGWRHFASQAEPPAYKP
jgi:thiamine-monophosphate kinase